MANRFMSNHTNYIPPRRQTEPFSNMIDTVNQFNTFRADPAQFLASRGINIPAEYANNPEQMGRYLLNNMPSSQQNGVLRAANMLRGMLGYR